MERSSVTRFVSLRIFKTDPNNKGKVNLGKVS